MHSPPSWKCCPTRRASTCSRWAERRGRWTPARRPARVGEGEAVWLPDRGESREPHAVDSRLHRKASSGCKSSCQAERSQSGPGAGAPGAGARRMLPAAAGFWPPRFRRPSCAPVPASGPALPRRLIGAPLETRLRVSERVGQSGVPFHCSTSAPASRRTRAPRARFRSGLWRPGKRVPASGPSPGVQSCLFLPPFLRSKPPALVSWVLIFSSRA